MVPMLALWEFSEFKEGITPFFERGGIELNGPGRNGFAFLKATTDIKGALQEASVILIYIPAYGHRRFSKGIFHERSGERELQSRGDSVREAGRG